MSDTTKREEVNEQIKKNLSYIPNEDYEDGLTEGTRVVIVAECPICFWRSPAFELEDRPNAHWFACQRAREVFHAHARLHLQPRIIEVNDE